VNCDEDHSVLVSSVTTKTLYSLFFELSVAMVTLVLVNCEKMHQFYEIGVLGRV
jgi:hypothetical protein